MGCRSHCHSAKSVTHNLEQVGSASVITQQASNHSTEIVVHQVVLVLDLAGLHDPTPHNLSPVIRTNPGSVSESLT